MPKAKLVSILFLAALLGCASAPTLPPRNVESLIEEYQTNVEYAQSAISHATCLRSLDLAELNPSEIYDELLLQDILNYTEIVLDGAKRQGATPPHQYQVYPSFKQYLAESSEITGQLAQLWANGNIYLEQPTPLSMRIARHEKPVWDWLRTSKMGEERATFRYLIPAYDTTNTISNLTTAISTNALRASYLSDSESYQAIYECSNINGIYDRRFSGTENLAFEDAKAVVDFASMTSREREASGKEKRIERVKRIEDAIDTIKALEKIF